jgi:hypothetical protein
MWVVSVDVSNGLDGSFGLDAELGHVVLDGGVETGTTSCVISRGKCVSLIGCEGSENEIRQ